MFFQDPTIPKEVLSEVLKRLPKKDRLTMRMTCKRFRDSANALFWREAKAIDSNDFFQRMRKLPVECKRLILLDNSRHTFKLAEKIAYVLSLSSEKRLEELLKSDYLSKEEVIRAQRYRYGNDFTLDYLIIALYTGLITSTQVRKLRAQSFLDRTYLRIIFGEEHGLRILQENLFDLIKVVKRKFTKALFSDGCLFALREGFVTHEHVAKLDSDILELLFSENGITALRQKAITVDDAIRLNAITLKCLLAPHSIVALRERLITVEQIITMRPGFAYFLLSRHCFTALKEQLFTLEQAQCVSLGALKCLLTDNGLTVLRESLISIEQIIEMSTGCLRYLLTDKGIENMRRGDITPEKANEMNLNDLQQFLDIKPSLFHWNKK